MSQRESVGHAWKGWLVPSPVYGVGKTWGAIGPTPKKQAGSLSLLPNGRVSLLARANLPFYFCACSPGSASCGPAFTLKLPYLPPQASLGHPEDQEHILSICVLVFLICTKHLSTC